MTRKKSKKWFIKVRGSYLPNTWQAWLLYVPYFIFLLWVFVAAVWAKSSVAEVFFVVFPVWVAAAVVMTWIAANKS